LYQPQPWVTMFDAVRNATGQDFYTIGSTEDSSFFLAFDALSPWVNLGQWGEATGATTYDKYYNWVELEHQSLFTGVGSYPGRVVFGGVAPGFDDYTEDWGDCEVREIPRDPVVFNATFAYLKTQNVTGIVVETWDDWTEGTNVEPDVVNGTYLLLNLRQNLAYLFDLPQDPAGDEALVQKWTNFGQARNCSGLAPVVMPPQVQLTCSAPTSDSESATSTGGSGSTSSGDSQGEQGGSHASYIRSFSANILLFLVGVLVLA